MSNLLKACVGPVFDIGFCFKKDTCRKITSILKKRDYVKFSKHQCNLYLTSVPLKNEICHKMTFISKNKDYFAIAKSKCDPYLTSVPQKNKSCQKNNVYP